MTRVTTDRSYVVALTDATDACDVGGKASNLSRLLALDQPVPEGLVVSTAAFSQFLDEHDLSPAIAAACTDLDVREPAAIRSTADSIAALLRHYPLPLRLTADLDAAMTPFLEDILIVRSSAVGEDSDALSFAGQLDSIPGVCGARSVRQAILDVWASRWSARALTYQLARGASLGGVGVIVQRQIDSAWSGVLFTASPANDREMLIEFCAGPGDALVSGQVSPDRITVDRNTLRTPARASLSPWLPELTRRALAIERAFGCAQDIEWTVDTAGRLWIVQARPITAAARHARTRVPSAASDTASHQGRTVCFSNANVNENFPQAISPLLYSIARTGYYHYFRNLGLAFGLSRRRIADMEQPLRHIIGVHGARMYYNLTSIHGVLRSAPFGNRLAAWFNQFVGSEDTDTAAFAAAGARGETVPLLRKAAQVCELSVIAAQAGWQYLWVSRRVARFERTVTAFADRTHPRLLETRRRGELLQDFRAFCEIRNHRWLDASLADTASMVCYGVLQQWLSRAFPAADQTALHNSLLKALPGLPSGMPAAELWQLSRRVRDDRRLLDLLGMASTADALDTIRRDPSFGQFSRELDRFLENWGFRCSGELMLTVKSFQDDPAPLLEIIKSYVGSDGDSPADHLRVQKAERLRETERVAAVLRRRRLIAGVPFVHQWLVVSVLLRWTQRAIVFRERARLKQALLYSRLRHVALTLGERLVSDGRIDRRDDIFFLTAEEIDDLVSGCSMFPDHQRPIVAVRRQAHLDLSAATPPDSIELGEGEYAYDCTDNAHPAVRDGTMRGLGVCGGQTTGRAAVLRDVTDVHGLQPGDVLITRQTDPGWAAVFPLISGLVMERGGMLSHGAIIAREFGIPSVVGIPDATTLVPHGVRVHVDGDRGLVRMDAEADRTRLAC